MREIIFRSPDADYLASEAARLGFANEDGTIITNGSFANGGGWFLNVVGTVYEPVTPPANPNDPWPAPVAREGYFGRLRLNGTPDDMPTFSSAITQYVYAAGDMQTPSGAATAAGKWVDAETGADAPDFVPEIGVIA